MYTQQELDALYVSNSIQYADNLRIERIKNLFQIASAIFTIALAIYMMMPKKGK